MLLARIEYSHGRDPKQVEHRVLDDEAAYAELEVAQKRKQGSYEYSYGFEYDYDLSLEDLETVKVDELRGLTLRDLKKLIEQL